MKEVTIVSYCDGFAHDDGDRARSSIERVVAVDNGRPVTLDLCDNCDTVIESMLRLMERGAVAKGPGGRKKGSTAAPKVATPRSEGAPRNNAPLTSIPFEGPHICPVCKDEGVDFESRSRSALGQHLSSRHGKGFKDFIVQQAS